MPTVYEFAGLGQCEEASNGTIEVLGWQVDKVVCGLF
jgi:hypothetical protein